MKGILGILPVAGLAAALAGVASAEPTVRATLFDQPNFEGASITIVEGSPDLDSRDFAGRAMSGHFDGDWTLCDQPGLDGRCASVSGDVADLATVGLSRRVISLREAQDQASDARPDRYADARGDQTRDDMADAHDERVPGPRAAEPPAPLAAVPPPPASHYAEGPRSAVSAAPQAAVAAARGKGEAGRSATFFARPQRGGADIEVDAQGPANQFCHDQGLGPAVYFDTDGRALRDVLCRQN